MRKAITIGVVLLIAIATGIVAITTFSAGPSIPHPWGKVQFVRFVTNDNTRHATFSFTSYFGWPVSNATATETKTNSDWPSRLWPHPTLGPSPVYVALSEPLSGGGTCTFTVDVPQTTGAWRVLVRTTKQNITSGDRRRSRLHGWFSINGMDIIADRISTEATGHYISAGPVLID